MDMNSGRVDSRHGHFCASDDRSGHTERKDSWNDDCSPDAHDFLRQKLPRSAGQILQLCTIPGGSVVKGSIVGFGPFYAWLQSLSQNFLKGDFCF